MNSTGASEWLTVGIFEWQIIQVWHFKET